MTKPWHPRVQGGRTRGRYQPRRPAKRPRYDPVQRFLKGLVMAALAAVIGTVAVNNWPLDVPGVDFPGRTEQPAPRGGTRVARADRVIDGDTFIALGQRIRVADIDTPEVRGRCPYETRLAARATARMRALLGQGPFELHPLASGRDRDRYGRSLRIVTRGGRSLGDQLVTEGLARTWSGRREPWC